MLKRYKDATEKHAFWTSDCRIQRHLHILVLLLIYILIRVLKSEAQLFKSIILPGFQTGQERIEDFISIF